MRRFSFSWSPSLSSTTSPRVDLRGDDAWDVLDGAVDRDGPARSFNGFATTSCLIDDPRGSCLMRSLLPSAIRGRASALTDFPNLLTYSLIHLFTSSPTYLPIDLPTQIPTYLPTYDLLTY